MKTLITKKWLNQHIYIYREREIERERPNNDTMYSQAFKNVNCSKLKEIRVKKAQTQGFVIEVWIIVYIPALGVAT